MIRKINERQILAKTERFMDYGLGTPCPDKVLLLEVGPTRSFDKLHIRRASQCIPPWVSEDKDIEIIAYGEDRAQVLHRLGELDREGYRNLYIFDGDAGESPKEEWVADSLWQQSSLLPADRLSPKLPVDSEGGAAVHQMHLPRKPQTPVPGSAGPGAEAA